MVNPADIVKFMGFKNKFQANHPKFVQFLGYISRTGINEGTIIEVTVTKPGEDPVAGNIKITQEDLQMLAELRSLSK